MHSNTAHDLRIDRRQASAHSAIVLIAARTSSLLTANANCSRLQPACFWAIGKLFVVRTI
jgi:hypothetical protein